MWRVSKVGFVCPSICVFLMYILLDSISMIKSELQNWDTTYLEKLYSPIATTNGQYSHLLAWMPRHIHHSTLTAFGFSFTDGRVGVVCVTHTFKVNCPWRERWTGQRVLCGGEGRVRDERFVGSEEGGEGGSTGESTPFGPFRWGMEPFESI